MNDSTHDALAAACPTWHSATLLVKDERGEIVGYGWMEKGGGVVVRADAEGVKLLQCDAREGENTMDLVVTKVHRHPESPVAATVMLAWQSEGRQIAVDGIIVPAAVADGFEKLLNAGPSGSIMTGETRAEGSPRS